MASVFFEDQGYQISKKVLHQDNQSAKKLLKNGKESAGTRSHHIETRFYWSTDRLKRHDIEVEHCTTSLMLADFFYQAFAGYIVQTYEKCGAGN